MPLLAERRCLQAGAQSVQIDEVSVSCLIGIFNFSLQHWYGLQRDNAKLQLCICAKDTFMPVKELQAAGIPSGLLQPKFCLLGTYLQLTTQPPGLHM